jgi:hypothetical protein
MNVRPRIGRRESPGKERSDYEHRKEEYELAIRTHTVTLDQVVEANHKRFHDEGPGADIYGEYYPRLLKSFDDQHGGIDRSYFGRHSESAAILTKEKELHVKVGSSEFDDNEFIGILSDLTLLHLQAREFLNEDDFRICMDPVFNVVTHCLDSVEGMVSRTERQNSQKRRNSSSANSISKQRDHIKGLLSREYSRANQAFYRVIQRNALVRYFYGMLIGVAALSVLAYWMGFIYNDSIFGLPHKLMGTVVVGGAVGAFISVLTRISSGRFSLSQSTVSLQEAKRRALMLWILGAFRPLMGAIFASVFVIFQYSGLVPVKPEVADPDLANTYYAGIAFIAGFSERWAQDMVVSTRTTLFEPRPSIATPGSETTSETSRRAVQ